MARLSVEEIKLYQRGLERREEQKERQRSPNRRTKVSADQRKREEQALKQYE